jgi:hypothetical protein
MEKWYFNRLRTMSPAEIYYRIKRLITGYLEEKTGYDTKFDQELFKSKSNILDIHEGALKICTINFKIFGSGFNFSNPAEIDWHRDILSGEVYSLSFYRKINILENQNLSAKCVWEINRLQFLTGICMNYKIMKSRGELDLFMQLNKSWSLNNPFLMGVNWYSNIEVNLRLITWFLCWEILDAENLMSEDLIFRQFVENDWLPLIRKHCLYSYKNPSKYSSANNHLVSEYAGLFIASSKWKFRESEKWINYAQKGLENEIIKQNSGEGINKEEAAEYIQFITDFFLISYIVGEKTNKPFSSQFRQQLYKIFYYIYNILDCSGNFPKYGDEDDGKCFILDYDEKHNNFKSLLTSGAIIFKDPLLKTKSNGFDYKNHLLFSDEGKMIYESIPDLIYKENSIFYTKDGHFIFRKKADGEEIYLHFDAAPLGYLSIAAHGHADALSFVLDVDGQPVFIDSGTYTYHTEPEWRQYFIGTLAHNTVRINQKNQAVNGGPTLWIKHYKAFVIDVDSDSDIDRVKASHNGYLKDNAQHIREIVFDKIKNEFQILDTIVVREKDRIRIEIPFHVHPAVSISKPDSNFFLLSSGQSRKTEFYVDEKLVPVIIKGQIEPLILGWYSDSFLKKEATSAIYCKTYIESTTTFKFIIKII